MAAAHAGCFTMAVNATLGQKGIVPTLLETIATLTLEGLDVTGIHLYIKGKVPRITAE